jgi:hypothetical protein
MGGSCAQADKPEIQESGRPEGLPRTAAIARNCGHKKTPAIVVGALLRLHLAGLSGPVADLAATDRRLAWRAGSCKREKTGALQVGYVCRSQQPFRAVQIAGIDCSLKNLDLLEKRRFLV